MFAASVDKRYIRCNTSCIISYLKNRGIRTDPNASVHRSSRRPAVARMGGEAAERRVKRCQLQYLTTCTDGESRLLTRVKGLGSRSR